MNTLIEKFEGLIRGCITGFDRIVFKGLLLPVIFASGAMGFCQRKGILNKDYKQWMLGQTAALVQNVEQYAQDNCGQGIIPIPTWRIRKEDLAHKRQDQEQIESGLIGVWSCQEFGKSYRAQYCARKGFPQLSNYRVRCNHLYFYYDHADYGFMNIRLQTWFPYHVQICMNGREWLRRLLEREGIGFCARRNKFLHISDYRKAQRLLDTQMDARWPEILDGFVKNAFPTMRQTLGPDLSYYWTMWQSEWATDMIFDSSEALNPIADALMRHAFVTGNSGNVLRYLDRPITKKGRPYLRSNDTVCSRIQNFNDGVRVRHWVDQNSVKVYNEQNVLRVEMTMNNPHPFRIHRHKQGQSPSEPKELLPLRKGVADIPLRAKISQDINERFMADLAAFYNEKTVKEMFEDITCPGKRNGSRYRALDPVGKDCDLLLAVSDPANLVSGVSNKMLRQSLQGSKWAGQRTEKQLSARISRHLRLLRDHGIIRKIPKQNRYQLTKKGIQITTSLHAILSASTEQLLKIAA